MPLKQMEAGRKVADLARELGVSEATLYTWKSKFAGGERSTTAVRQPESNGSPDACSLVRPLSHDATLNLHNSMNRRTPSSLLKPIAQDNTIRPERESSFSPKANEWATWQGMC